MWRYYPTVIEVISRMWLEISLSVESHWDLDTQALNPRS